MKNKPVESGKEFRLPLFVYMVCCDCGLKHVHRYRIVRKENRNYLYLTAWRANHRGKEEGQYVLEKKQK